MKVLESSSGKSLQVSALKMLVHPKCSFSDYFFRQAHFYPFIQTLFNKGLRYVLNLSRVRLPDCCRLYAASCEIRTKRPLGRRTPLYLNVDKTIPGRHLVEKSFVHVKFTEQQWINIHLSGDGQAF